MDIERTYRNDIQALRGLAVLVVVLFHAGLGFPGGFVGVDVFFVISGFVITGVIGRQLEQTDRLRFADFYARRARRLLPALAAMSVPVLAVSVYLLPTNGVQQNAAKTAGSASVFASNLYLYRFGVNYFNPPQVNPFLHTWSLGVEEQTYLILPIALVLLWALGRRLGAPRMLTTAGIVTASMASLGLSLVLTTGTRVLHVPLPERFAFYTPVTRFWEFGAGVVLALAAARLPRSRAAGIGSGIVGCGLILTACFAFGLDTPFPGRAALVPVAGAALVIAAGTLSPQWERSASVPPLVWLGGLSYAWYLWHWPLIVFAQILWPSSRTAVIASVGVSLLAAVVSRRLVEQRFRYDSRLVGRRAIALTAGCVVIGLVAAGVVLGGARRGWGNADLQARIVEARHSRPERDGCDSVLRSSPCIYPGSGSTSVALVGDSHAGVVGDVALEAAQATGATFEVWTRPGCPFLVGVSLTGAGSSECRQWSDDVMAWLTDHPPTVLVLHALATSYPGAGLRRDAPAAPGTTDGDGVALYVDGTAAIARRLAPLGTRTVVITDVPTFPGSSVERASLRDPDPRPVVRSRSDVEAADAAMNRAFAALGRSDGIVVLDPVPALCGPQTCTQRSSRWIYRDENHLTPYGASKLRGLFDAAVSGSGSVPAPEAGTRP